MMGFSLGIVGLPNVGKSTIFNALTASAAATDNYPFCTIDPNVGVVPVPDSRLEQVAACAKPTKVTPTTLEFVDIAGLVKGASRGAGRGNQFLSHIRTVDAIGHVVRCFIDSEISHVDGSVDPVRDAEVVNLELVLKDIETVEKRLERRGKIAKAGDKSAQRECTHMEQILQNLEQGIPVRAQTLQPQTKEVVDSLSLLTAKPLLYIANIAEEDIGDPHKAIQALNELATREGNPLVSICGKLEAEIMELPTEERELFLQEAGLLEPGLNTLVSAGFALLGLVKFFTVVGKEVRAWTIPQGTTVAVAAGKIHSDMEKGFIKAEVISYRDLIEQGSMAAVRAKGLMSVEGRDYQVQDGDVITIRFST